LLNNYIQIPVHVGANQALVVKYEFTEKPFHGSDGFNDLDFGDEPDVSRVSPEPACDAIRRIVSENKGSVIYVKQ